ncbi:MAG: protein-glutamate O-methyltransferase CheR [Bacteroidales bacterium]|nr:protein-glutamate O-methyltransferase CheR [Bacteroidales bacterium]
MIVTSIQNPDLDDDSLVENVELELLLQAVYLKYGYDFREYSRAHIKRRVLHYIANKRLPNISSLQHELLIEKKCFDELLQELSINVTEMFRGPGFYKSIREKVAGLLKTYPYIKIWHAGCSTGEEVYSMAILLKEEGLYDRTQIYATDFNPRVVKSAREATFPLKYIKEYTSNYQKSGGQESFSDYYRATNSSVIFDRSLTKNMVFAEHNLVTDRVFAEVNMIISRNVLIYFNRHLQNKVLSLFDESLSTGGFLGLGNKETISFSDIAPKYKIIDAREKIYKKSHE